MRLNEKMNLTTIHNLQDQLQQSEMECHRLRDRAADMTAEHLPKVNHLLGQVESLASNNVNHEMESWPQLQMEIVAALEIEDLKRKLAYTIEAKRLESMRLDDTKMELAAVEQRNMQIVTELRVRLAQYQGDSGDADHDDSGLTEVLEQLLAAKEERNVLKCEVEALKVYYEQQEQQYKQEIADERWKTKSLETALAETRKVLDDFHVTRAAPVPITSPTPPVPKEPVAIGTEGRAVSGRQLLRLWKENQLGSNNRNSEEPGSDIGLEPAMTGRVESSQNLAQATVSSMSSGEVPSRRSTSSSTSSRRSTPSSTSSRRPRKMHGRHGTPSSASSTGSLPVPSVEPFAYTPPDTMCLSIVMTLMHWHLENDTDACCPWHTSFRAARQVFKKLETKPCDDKLRPFTGFQCKCCLAANPSQVTVCGICCHPRPDVNNSEGHGNRIEITPKQNDLQQRN